MATDQDDSDIPESGGVFTFGRSRFGENVPNKFWIRNDEVQQAACGDQHTVLLAESKRIFVFGDNAYGQLGLGHTKAQTKPSCVKTLKGEQVSVIGCGVNHTLVGTSTGELFAFGQNMDHQCGLDDVNSIDTPTKVPLQTPIEFTQLCGGSSHSAGVDRSGKVYVWGDNSEGQLGLGDSVDEIETPTRLPLNDTAVHVACGYYHTAVVTASGCLYTFGEQEGGKLGHEDEDAKVPVQVDIKEKVVWASCGGKHTVAVTGKGGVYTFGEGASGQLGLGTNVMECSRPSLISSLSNIKIKVTSCGENFTAAISEKGNLYTFGDGRHGKLALGAENFSNQFRPFRVPRFANFLVKEVTCGGCHMIALARKTDEKEEDDEVLDPLNSAFANSLRVSTDTDLNSSISARDRRRAKESPEPLSRTLPPLTSSTRGLPPLNTTYNTSKLSPLQSSTLPNSLDKRKLPNASFSRGNAHLRTLSEADDDEENSNLSESEEESEEEESEEEDRRHQTSSKSKVAPTKNLTNDDDLGTVTPEDSSEEEESFQSQRQAMKRQSEKVTVNKGKTQNKKESLNNHGDSRLSKKLAKDQKKLAAKDEEKRGKFTRDDDSALEESEEEPTLPVDNKKHSKQLEKKGKSVRRKSRLKSEDEEESEEETKAPVKKSPVSIFGKKKNKSVNIEDDDEDDDDREEEEEKPRKSSKSKAKDVKKKKSKKVVESEEEEDDDEEDEKEEEKSKKKNKQSNNNSKPEEKPVEKKSRACVIL